VGNMMISFFSIIWLSFLAISSVISCWFHCNQHFADW
jgi:hypothetical protein